MIMEKYRSLVGFHQEVHKSREKSWHDRHIKRNCFKEGDLVLMYDKKSLEHPGKLRMHWLGPYKVNTITDRGDVQLNYLGGTKLRGMINGSRSKLYRASRSPGIKKNQRRYCVEKMKI
jgi:hypothetical protein